MDEKEVEIEVGNKSKGDHHAHDIEVEEVSSGL